MPRHAKIAIGHHGTTVATARKLADREEHFKAKQNEGDWLGIGAYFWQDAPMRARYWAQKKYKGQAAVVSAKINLKDALDLLDLTDFLELQILQEAFLEFEKSSGTTYTQKPLKILDGVVYVPKPGVAGFINDRDQAFLEFAIPILQETRRSNITAIRAAFVYGRAMHATSFLFDWAHVQICVREPYTQKVISEIKIVEQDEE